VQRAPSASVKEQSVATNNARHAYVQKIAVDAWIGWRRAPVGQVVKPVPTKETSPGTEPRDDSYTQLGREVQPR
jgi:hypothetical protein